MTLLRHLRTTLSLLVAALAVGSLDAAETSAEAPAPYQVGDVFAAFTVRDQHDVPFTAAPGENLRHLIVSYTMGTGKDVNRHLERKGAGYLEKHDAAFLADIHGMPGVGRVFALPKMRRYPHRILLGDDAHLLDRHPRAENRITMFSFDAKGVITAIRQLDPETQLDTLFTP